MYYNQERKERYIKKEEGNTALPYNFFPRWFGRSEKFETKYGLDLCDWTSLQIVDFYNYYVKGIGELRNAHSQFKKYANWCIQNGLAHDTQNHFDEIDPDTLLNYINKTEIRKRIITREELTNGLPRLENPVDQFFMLALFEGLRGAAYSEITAAKLSQIDGNYINTISGRRLRISNTIKTIADDSAKEYIYYTLRSNGGIRRTKLIGTNDEIFKLSEVAKFDTQEERDKSAYASLRLKFKNIKQQMGLNETMKYDDIYISGMIDAVSRALKENNIDFETFYLDKKYATKRDELIFIYGNRLDIGQPRKDFFAQYGEYL